MYYLKVHDKTVEIKLIVNNLIYLRLTKEQLEDVFFFGFYDVNIENIEYFDCAIEIIKNKIRFIEVIDQKQNSIFDYDELDYLYDFEICKKHSLTKNELILIVEKIYKKYSHLPKLKDIYFISKRVTNIHDKYGNDLKIEFYSFNQKNVNYKNINKFVYSFLKAHCKHCNLKEYSFHAQCALKLFENNRLYK